MKIHLPHPCPVSVSGYSGGFDCSLCHKKVTDFRNHSVAEIESASQKAGGDICGIFSMEQVRVNQVPERKEIQPLKGSLRRFLTAVAAVLLPLLITPTLQASPDIPLNRDEYLPSFRGQGETLISGRLEDKNGNNQAGIGVVIRRGNLVLGSTVTGADGSFVISLPGTEYADNDLTLDFVRKKFRTVSKTVAQPKAEVCVTYQTDWRKQNWKPRPGNFRHRRIMGCPRF
jgi:hypothetical protein